MAYVSGAQAAAHALRLNDLHPHLTMLYVHPYSEIPGWQSVHLTDLQVYLAACCKGSHDLRSLQLAEPAALQVGLRAVDEQAVHEHIAFGGG